MTFTNFGKQALTWSLGSEMTNNYISYVGIGSGSGTAGVSDVTLLHEVSRTIITGSPDFTTAKKVEFQADFNAIQMSGIHLTEFGLLASGPSHIGSVWQRESFGSIVFDGTQELQLISTLEVL